jgi:hypothetical protein
MVNMREVVLVLVSDLPCTQEHTLQCGACQHPTFTNEEPRGSRAWLMALLLLPSLAGARGGFAISVKVRLFHKVAVRSDYCICGCAEHWGTVSAKARPSRLPSSCCYSSKCTQDSCDRLSAVSLLQKGVQGPRTSDGPHV